MGLWIIGTVMPARTQAGAVIRAMLEAYRRTLEKTMAMSRSMGEVVQASAIPLIESPDDAVVWGVALGLHDEVEAVLQRSSEDLQTGRSTGAYLPMWYLAGSSEPRLVGRRRGRLRPRPDGVVRRSRISAA